MKRVFTDKGKRIKENRLNSVSTAISSMNIKYNIGNKFIKTKKNEKVRIIIAYSIKIVITNNTTPKKTPICNKPSLNLSWSNLSLSLTLIIPSKSFTQLTIEIILKTAITGRWIGGT